MLFKVGVFCTILFLGVKSLNYKIVNTIQGPVKGYESDIENVYSFFSIPYATVPTGLDRFKPPLPPPTWTEPFEAIEKDIFCPQSGHKLDNGDVYREQCLVASVFTPNTTAENLPVLVYVHGGGFFIGHGNEYTPQHLVKSGKIIAVTFNYRLGPPGFLCLGTEAIPGNAGMKDQVALLRWVNKNIANFGGNPKDVTIAGYSAGAVSVDLLMLSKMAQGLFNKVIPESGANTLDAGFQIHPLEYAKLYARNLKFENVDDIKALEQFYLTVPLNKLISIDVLNGMDNVKILSPCIERDVGQDERFLEDSPVNIITSGNYNKYPILYGFSEMEGLFRIGNFEKIKNMMNDNFAFFLPNDLHFTTEKEKEHVVQMIKKFYFGDDPVGANNILKYIDYFTDTMFAYHILRTVQLQVRAGNDKVYLYEYVFVDNDVDIIPYTKKRGATHCAQTMAVLDSPNEDNITQEYKTMKNYMRDIWLNFILKGEPVPSGSPFPSWSPVTTEDNLSYMLLNNTIEYRDKLLYERAQFWEKIYDKYYQHPSAPNPEINNFSVRNGSSVLYILMTSFLLHYSLQKIPT
ncbi:juvenile hormone esterase-like [Colias croceus]|uniref:juvenile hormone esterase-like n=1 Tax=Colias crocea TaxID=72248 RepID=UPI001E27BDA8|nr:juvenile hormone esterase-like [Colias croceus]